jgi:REP element-mobilizing transposase RayT
MFDVGRSMFDVRSPLYLLPPEANSFHPTPPQNPYRPAPPFGGSHGAARPTTPYHIFHIMDSIGRKTLLHDVPSDVIPNPEGEVFFITICTEPRGINQLATPEVWMQIVESIQVREKRNDLKCRLLLAMPDHLHGLVEFPGDKPMKKVISAFKSWMAKSKGIRWQRDFFDHRLRSWESSVEKANYIRMNPVRAGLCVSPQDWPYVINR